MATVTKLKAAVNNKNLPILGEDGNLYNYYYGRFVDKITKQGYLPTAEEQNALNVFINNGIDNGWIDSVAYLLPFIGNQAYPKAGIVPLIDNMSDYVISENSVSADDFIYQNDGRIKHYTNGGHERFGLGFMSNQLGFSDAYSLYANIHYDSGDEEGGACNQIFTVYNNEGTNKAVFYCRKGMDTHGSSTENRIIFAIKIADLESTDIYYFNQSSVSVDNLPYNFDMFYSRYNDNDNVVKYKKYFKGGQYTTGIFSTGDSSNPIGYATGEYCIGGTNSQGYVSKQNIMAVFFPNLVNEVVLNAFTSAVAALNTALGR